MNTAELAQRIYTLDPYHFCDEDINPEDIELSLALEPLAIIEYLLNHIEEMED